jgi:RNA polymerase sigma-70 factor (ECF subfamily)
MDEEQAIQRLKSGDLGGLEFLVLQYQVKAISTAYLITRDTASAEDVVQDAFLHLRNSIHTFDATRPFQPWFLRSVSRAAVKAARKSASYLSPGAEWEDLLAEDESVEQQVESTEFQDKLWDTMERFTPRQRAVVVQRYFLEMSEKEMAVELEASPGTVKWLLYNARERLRFLFAERRMK